MKNIGLCIVVIICFPFTLLGQSLSTIDSIRNVKIDAFIKSTESIDTYANRLSVFVTDKLLSGKVFEDKQWNEIHGFLKNIKDVTNKVKVDSVFESQSIKQMNLNAEFAHFEEQRSLMESVFLPFEKYKGRKLYQAQMNYAEARVQKFLVATANFKQYLNLLKISIVDDLMKKIRLRIDSTDVLIDINKHIICEIDEYQKDKMPKLKKNIDSVKRAVDSVNKKADTILIVLKGDQNPYKQYAIVSGYSNVFGLAYLHSIGKSLDPKEGNFIGAELLLPVDARTATDIGGFLLYGLRYDKLLLQAGFGYLKNNNTMENTSWKVAALYTPHHFGIGASYSPLTKAGIQISYRW